MITEGKENLAVEANDLAIGYVLKGGRRKVVHQGLHLSLRVGEVTCLLGLNGAGKSTLLRTLCGFQPALAGEIRVLGKPWSFIRGLSFPRRSGSC